MPSDQVLVSVSFREIPLFENAALQSVSATGAFLHTESPMPVGTTLILSPKRSPEVKVQASVGLVVEVCRGVKRPDGEQPGMGLVFASGGESLLGLLEDLSSTTAAPAVIAPVPAAPAISPALVAPELPAAIPMPRLDPAEPPVFEEVPTKVERRVVVSAPSEEAAALQPTASGSLTVEAAPPPRVSDEPSVIIADHSPEPEGDPDQPDKVVMEVEAELSGADESEEEGEIDGEGGAEGEGDAEDADSKKKKKRTRSRRRKKR